MVSVSSGCGVAGGRRFEDSLARLDVFLPSPSCAAPAKTGVIGDDPLCAAWVLGVAQLAKMRSTSGGSMRSRRLPIRVGQVNGASGERTRCCLPPCCHTTAEQPACRCCDLLQPALITGTQSAWRAPAAPCTVLKKLHWSGRFPGDGWMDTTGAEDKPSAKQCQKVSVSRRRPNGPGYKPCRMAEQAVSPPLLGNGPKAGDQPLLAHHRRDVATVSQVPGLLVG